MVSDSAAMRIGLLAEYGFHGKTIQEMVRKYDGEEYHLSTIYKAIKDQGIRLRDYRDGVGSGAGDTLRVVKDKLAAKKTPKVKTRTVAVQPATQPVVN
jgi:hypothetical protein